MGRTSRQPPQVLRRLTPARAVNMQHNRSENDRQSTSYRWGTRLQKPNLSNWTGFRIRRGRRAPSATAFGRSKVYRPRKLMCLKASGETLAISACETPGYCGGPIEDQRSVVYILQKSHAK